MSEKISRRRLVQAGAVAAAGAALPTTGAEARNRRRKRPVQDVVVVGAGLAGLMAARKLVAKGKRVKVLEARGRVGGRTYSPRHAGVALDVGGQWLGPTQDKVAALAGNWASGPSSPTGRGRPFISAAATGPCST